jgi:hypothetical protein
VLDAGAAKITIEGPPAELFHAGVDLANPDGGRIEWVEQHNSSSPPPA